MPPALSDSASDAAGKQTLAGPGQPARTHRPDRETRALSVAMPVLGIHLPIELGNGKNAKAGTEVRLG